MSKLATKINALTVYVTATGLKVGSSGKVQHPGEVAVLLGKGDRRRLRKQLRAIKRGDLAFASVA